MCAQSTCHSITRCFFPLWPQPGSPWPQPGPPWPQPGLTTGGRQKIVAIASAVARCQNQLGQRAGQSELLTNGDCQSAGRTKDSNMGKEPPHMGVYIEYSRRKTLKDLCKSNNKPLQPPSARSRLEPEVRHRTEKSQVSRTWERRIPGGLGRIGLINWLLGWHQLFVDKH